MAADRRHETPGSEMEILIGHSSVTSQRVSVCTASPAPRPVLCGQTWWQDAGKSCPPPPGRGHSSDTVCTCTDLGVYGTSPEIAQHERWYALQAGRHTLYECAGLHTPMQLTPHLCLLKWPLPQSSYYMTTFKIMSMLLC